MAAKELSPPPLKLRGFLPILAEAFIEPAEEPRDRDRSTATLYVKVRNANGTPILGLLQYNFSVSSCPADSADSRILPVLKTTYIKADDKYEVQIEVPTRNHVDLMRHTVTVFISRALNRDGFLEVGHVCCQPRFSPKA